MNLRTVRHYGEIPKPDKNEILIATSQDRLLDSGMPFMNRGNRPDWWSSLPSNPGSYRRCYGITDLMQMGFTVPMWTDVQVTHNHENGLNVRTSFQDFEVESFGFQQVGSCPITDNRHYKEIAFPKIVSPFHVRTPKGWSILTFQHPFLYDQNFQVFPGVIHADFYHEMNVVLNIMSSNDFVIKAGTPVLYCIPFQRKSANALSTISYAASNVAKLLRGHGIGHSGISLFSHAHKGLYRQRLRQADS